MLYLTSTNLITSVSVSLRKAEQSAYASGTRAPSSSYLPDYGDIQHRVGDTAARGAQNYLRDEENQRAVSRRGKPCFKRDDAGGHYVA